VGRDEREKGVEDAYVIDDQQTTDERERKVKLKRGCEKFF